MRRMGSLPFDHDKVAIQTETLHRQECEILLAQGKKVSLQGFRLFGINLGFQFQKIIQHVFEGINVFFLFFTSRFQFVFLKKHGSLNWPKGPLRGLLRWPFRSWQDFWLWRGF